MDRVLVTGGSGYIAGYCIPLLLNQGWEVRATVRDVNREGEVRRTLGMPPPPADDRLAFVAADLESDTGWKEAAAGCRFVLHLASPLPSTNPKNDDELVRPARDGALRVLRAARDAGVERVVMTSSVAAIAYGRGGRETQFTEGDWSDETNLSDTSAYERSKTIAERAAWAWLAAEGGSLQLATVNPGAVLGPVLGPDFSASLEVVRKLMDGSLPATPRLGWALVDVRDIADLQLKAMTSPAATGQRYAAAGPFLWMGDIAAILRARAPAIARKVPRRAMPDWLLRLAAPFDPVIRDRLFELGKRRPVSSAKAEAQLGWSRRPVEETIVDTAQSLVTFGVVRA